MDRLFLQSFVIPLVSVLLGGAMNWFFGGLYYKRSGDELRKEAASLQKASSAIVYLLEHRDAEIEVRRDGAGHVVGLIVSTDGHARGTSMVKGVASDAKTDA